MAADSKSNRRSSGGRSDDSEKRTASRRRGGEEEGGRQAGGGRGGARKAASGTRKTAAKRGGEGGRKTAAKRGGEGGGRKSAAKKTGSKTGGRSAAKTGGRSAAKAASSRRGESGGRAAKKSSGRGGSAASKEAGARGRRRKTDALSLLKEDHERVDEMFRKFERMKEGDERKQQLLEQILQEVRVHAQVEEELFYPALRTVLEEDGKEKEVKLISEADVEHETVKWLMAELEGGRLESEMVDARVKVMGEYIRHHVEEEEGQIFRAAKRTDIDLEELGRQMEARKQELMGGHEPGGEEEMAAMGVLGSDSAQRGETQPGTH